MADINSDSHTMSPDKEEIEEKQEPETGMAESDCKNNTKCKEDQQNKGDDDGDCKGAYTAGTRGFPPSRLTPRGVFGGIPHMGSNPFASRSCICKSTLDGGQSNESGPSLWPGLTPSKLGGAVGLSSPLSRPVLRPPQLNSPALSTPPRGETTPTRSIFPLNPPRLGNPFSKVPQNEVDDAVDKGSKSEEPATPTSTVTSQASSIAGTPSTVRFVPLGTPSSTPQESSSSALSSTPTSFVFGQNLRERVETTPNHATQTASTSKQNENGIAEAGCSSAPTTNGTTAEMLFSAGLKEQGPELNLENGEPAKSLSEAAREYEESRSAVKRKYEQVAVLTGEEDETNVLQVTAKLFAYDKVAGAWKERGHGQLRLNDKVESRSGGTSPGSGGLQSRIIMRTFGSLRVVLNTKVWAAMVVDRASPSSLRITAMDNDKIKVFLIKTSVKEADSLHTALERRVVSQRQRAPQSTNCSESSSISAAASSSPPHSTSHHSGTDVEEARLGVEASSLPSNEPILKKGRTSDASADSSGNSDDGPDLEL